ncbi:autotransporter outer membrane beta-barrel domain-containing protein [Nitratireductor indicus]|uniref:autotransporter outer membrane beta-barrel domain-containing protein n=1 Tax=Nitratireductor indicus TaxID=721133 RepID=UPI002875AEC4|nr:autotransporter outer membrane beta-barrel domain-containing protein [Nitratireductor indicus]MDS1135994.1 autotransporter outer membrane beta-barrel domain-containing protein [Nitratireductor indicus]
MHDISVCYRGGRMTKWRGKVASVAGFYGSVAILAVGGAISPVLFLPSWTGVADIAWADCTVQLDSSYLCSGVSSGQTIYEAAPLTIIADSTFNVSNPGGVGLDISSTDGGINFTQQNGSTITGSSTGIYSTLSTSGALDLMISGNVNGDGNAAIWAVNSSPATNLSVTQTADSTITGLTHGIRVDNYGSGAASVTTAGIVNQTQIGAANYDTYGVYAYNAASATDINLIQTGGAISGNWYGMFGNNLGTGATSIISSGHVTAVERGGLWAYNGGNATDIVIEQTAGGTVEGGLYGVFANNAGTGTTTLTLAGTVTATGIYGVYSYNRGQTTGLTVNQTAGTITGPSLGILAVNIGTGATAVSVAGDVIGTDRFGIAARGGAETTGVTVQQTAGSITGNTGILLKNEGTGPSLVSVAGEVSGTGGAGIQTIAAIGTTIDIAASATVSAVSGIAIRDGGDDFNVFNNWIDPTASDMIGGNVVVNSAGIVTGDAVLGLGDDRLNLTGGTYTGNIYGDDRDDVQSSDGAVNHEGNDTFSWTGGTLVGGFYGQDGSDTANVNASTYDGSQVLDGGDDTSIADGMIDTLTLDGVTVTTNGSKVTNWEIVNLDGANLSIDDGAWSVGEPDEGTTGVFLNNGSALDGMASLDFRGNMTIDATSAFVGTGAGAGAYLFSGNVTNAGTITTVDDAVGDVVTIDGNYTGDGGQMLFDVTLGDDGSRTDMVVINGDTSGTTNVGVNNVGGTGAQTSEGIRIIEVNGASNAEFSLISDYLVDGKPAAVAGAYAYQLYQGGTSTPTDGNWYLRSQLNPTDPVDPSDPLYQAGVPTYEAYPQLLLGLNGVPTLQQRVGNRFWAANGSNVAAQGAGSVSTPNAKPEEAGVAIEGNGIWGRIEGAHNSIEPRLSTSGTDYEQNVFKLQAGVDGLLTETENGKLIGGITVHYTHGKTETSSIHGDGEINTDGYGFGGTLTWYSDNGFYLDGQGQATWYTSDLNSVLASTSLTDGNDGFGYALSLEGGKRIAIDPVWSVTPQAQLVYSNVDFDRFTDVFGSRVNLAHGESLQGRLGLTLDHEDSWRNNKGMLNRAHIYGIANLYYEFLEGTKVDVDGVSFASRKDRVWGGVGIGGTYNWDDDKYSIYGEGLVSAGLNNLGDSYSIKGQLGFRMRW